MAKPDSEPSAEGAQGGPTEVAGAEPAGTADAALDAGSEAAGDAAARDEAPGRCAAELEQALEVVRAEAAQARDQALRARAEVDNVRKRAERDLENAHRYALERFVAELLPVKDSMELGLAAQSAQAEQLREGMVMTLRMLAVAVEKFGVRELDPAGERFDPELHQAMSVRAEEGAQAGTVLEVVQKGYLLNDRLVRPALVIVAQ